MHWKNILFQSSAVFIAVLISVRLFVPTGGTSEKSDETLSAQVQLLSAQMQRIENQLNKIDNDIAGQQFSSSRTQWQARVDEMSQNLRAIKENLARLDNRSGTPRPVEPASGLTAPVGQVPVMKPSVTGDPTAWIGKLSEEKRAKVEDIFNQHAESLREKLPQDGPLDPEIMKQIMEESDRELRQNLKSSLSDQEYRDFLNSLPKLPTAGSLPGSANLGG